MDNRSFFEKAGEFFEPAFQGIGKINRCALLDYPYHTNLGDHFIWLGQVYYLKEIKLARIAYSAGFPDFSFKKLDGLGAGAPIFMSGGGNLGDLWPRYQKFRETIISRYRDRPILIFPQSIFFSNSETMKRTCDVFNSHPDLTLLVRESASHEIAVRLFPNCKIFKALDAVFFLARFFEELTKHALRRESMLFLCRRDKERNISFSSLSPDFKEWTVSDWPSVKYPQALSFRERFGWYRFFLLKQMEKEANTADGKLELAGRIFDEPKERFSWQWTLRAVKQLVNRRFVVTDRLHGHILSLLLGIPNVLLPNSYHKNESFYKTWTQASPLCKFASSPAEVASVVRKFLA